MSSPPEQASLIFAYQLVDERLDAIDPDGWKHVSHGVKSNLAIAAYEFFFWLSRARIEIEAKLANKPSIPAQDGPTPSQA